MLSSILFFWDVTPCSSAGSYQDFLRNLMSLFIHFLKMGVSSSYTRLHGVMSQTILLFVSEVRFARLLALLSAQQ
jgi:hypothetical protein